MKNIVWLLSITSSMQNSVENMFFKKPVGVFSNKLFAEEAAKIYLKKLSEIENLKSDDFNISYEIIELEYV